MNKRLDSKNDVISMNSKFVFFLLCFAFLFVTLIASFIKEDEPRSLIENRRLKQFTAPTNSSVFEGQWMLDLEEYFLDQFAYRQSAVKNYFLFQDVLGVMERNGYIKGLNNRVLRKPSFGSEDNQSKIGNYANPRIEIIEKLNEICKESSSKLIYMQIPHMSRYNASQYPKYYEYNYIEDARQEYIIDSLKTKNIDTVDASNDLLNIHADEYIYFNTDNHYTFKGAYYAYQSLLNYINDVDNLNLSFPSWEDCDYYRNDNPLVGSYLYSFGDSGINRSDYLEYVVPKDMPNYERYEEGKASDIKIITDNNAYSAFMGGDRKNALIKTNREELPNILILGHSYTNALEVMAVYNFNEMHSIDPRLFDGNIGDYIRNNDLDYVVVIRDDMYVGSKGMKAIVE